MKTEVNHPRRELVEKILEKVERHGALQELKSVELQSVYPTKGWGRPSEKGKIKAEKLSEEAKETLTDIENTLYMVLDEAYDEGKEQRPTCQREEAP